MSEQPVTNVEDAVRELGALPMPSGPVPRDVEEELTGANLSLWEEEQTTARLRLALASAQRGRRELRFRLRFVEPGRARWRTAAIEAEAKLGALRARVAELEAERHVTNEALSDAAVQMRAERDRIVELEALAPAAIQSCRTCGAGYTYGEPCSTCLFRAQMAAELQARGLAGEHEASVHRAYRVSHDLPESGGA